MNLKIKAISPKIGNQIPTPFYASEGAAAMDLHACLDQAITIAPGQRGLIPTGLAIALPSADYVALIYGRSGMGIKQGVSLSNCVGVIDSDYRGELMVGLTNFGEEPYTISPCDRIAQLMISPVIRPTLQWEGQLDQTQRGKNGFGSTGQ